jgi:hypothetical protein
MDTRPLVTPTSSPRDILIDETTDIMIGAATDMMIIGVATVADLAAAEVIIGNGHHGFQNCRLLSS